MFRRLSKAFGSGGSSNAAAFAADFEEQEGPTTDDLFEEGTQRYFKVERRVNNGEFTWADLPANLRKEMNEVREDGCGLVSPVGRCCFVGTPLFNGKKQM